MSYTNWSKHENELKLTQAVKACSSIAGVLRHLGLKDHGGNFRSIKHHISRLDIDISHFTGQGWNKDNFKNRDYSDTSALKRSLIRDRGHRCESCSNSEWLGVAITLELEHCDGDKFNNDTSNLKLLCCNCHALTPTWRRRKSVLI